MNRQQLDRQIEYLLHALTLITHELQYLEGTNARTLRIRQTRLCAELERVQNQRVDAPQILSRQHNGSTFMQVGNETFRRP
ncbi:MAG TPA: hypothetical protein VGK87_00815 [Anaerolineae bacterium]|jgi:hypothetical protein